MAGASWTRFAVAETAEAQPQAVRLSTLRGCQLAIGRYPAFRYDGTGGGGPGISLSQAGRQRRLEFPADDLIIPPLDWRSTRWLGLPLPPGLTITICPETLHGQWDPSDGSIALTFASRFRFRIGSEQAALYRAPDLRVACTLSSSSASGVRHQASGQARQANGTTRLVGVARVEPSGDAWLDRFLGLPEEALAVLQCRVEIEA